MYYRPHYFCPSPDFTTSFVSQSVTNNRCAPSCGGAQEKSEGAHQKKFLLLASRRHCAPHLQIASDATAHRSVHFPPDAVHSRLKGVIGTEVGVTDDLAQRGGRRTSSRLFQSDEGRTPSRTPQTVDRITLAGMECDVHALWPRRRSWTFRKRPLQSLAVDAIRDVIRIFRFLLVLQIFNTLGNYYGKGTEAVQVVFHRQQLAWDIKNTEGKNNTRVEKKGVKGNR